MVSSVALGCCVCWRRDAVPAGRYFESTIAAHVTALFTTSRGIVDAGALHSSSRILGHLQRERSVVDSLPTRADLIFPKYRVVFVERNQLLVSDQTAECG